MDDLKNYKQTAAGEMIVTRHNWWKPYLELTDGQFIYARLRYKGTFKRNVIIESAAGSFTIKRKQLLGRTLLLNKGEEQTIGEMEPSVWKRNVTLQLTSGFESTYLFKKLFSRAYTLTNETYGDILEIKQVPFGFKKPFTVLFLPNNLQPNKPDMPLLAMIGVHFMLYRQQQATAAAVS